MMCDPLTPIVMDTNYMNKYFSTILSYDNKIIFLQFLRTYKSNIYLKLLFLLVEKDFCVDNLLRSVQMTE